MAPAADFPKVVSFTVTYACNLRCAMCGQWKPARWHGASVPRPADMPLGPWLTVSEEIARHPGTVVLVRGGEPFLYPPIIELLVFLKGKGLRVSIDTNGTLLEKHADAIARLGIDTLTISVDGPEQVHDAVRGVTGSFQKVRAGIEAVRRAESAHHTTVAKTLCFVISAESYAGLGAMPDVARQLGVHSIAIVPQYYYDGKCGKAYEDVMRRDLGCGASSWKGFSRESSGVDFEKFREQLRIYKSSLREVADAPFMVFSEQEYRTWFSGCSAEVKRRACRNPDLLADIQPDGSVNFCVDLPDYVIGNIRDNALGRIWRGERSERFRARLKKGPLPVCARCGAQYMAA